MNLGDLRTQFQTLLNRDDCTADMANTFLTQGMQRLQREIRVPSMERLLVYNSDPTTASAISQVAIPEDFIQLIDVLVMNDGSIPGYDIGDLVALDKLSFRALQKVPVLGRPRAYARYQSNLMIRGTVPAACEVHVYYYGEFSGFATDSDENEISASSPDLVVYAALSLAGDYFNHPRTDAWEARYQQYRDQVIGMAVDAEANGGPAAVASAYPSCDY